jgi:hypothetical protein
MPDKISKRHSRTNKGTNPQPISKAVLFVFWLSEKMSVVMVYLSRAPRPVNLLL